MAQHQHAFIYSSSSGMTDIGSLGGNSFALGINNNGEVVGYSYLADGATYHAFTWTSSTGMIDLGAPSGCCSQASAVNDSGNIAGFFINSAGQQVPAYWSASTGFVQIGNNSPADDSNNFGLGINSLNQVTGQIYRGDIVRAFVWDGGSLHFIAPLPGAAHSIGRSINKKGHIAGASTTTTTFSFYATFWTKSTGQTEIGIDPTLDYGAGFSVNENDEVVGIDVLPSGSANSFYWNSALGSKQLTSLGGTVTYAYSINRRGQIAGMSTLTGQSDHRAVVWSNWQNAPVSIGTLPGGNNSYAQGINDFGQVCGYSDIP